MAARMTLPHTQHRQSNIAVVRLCKGSKKIEIACYKNKVVAYRSGAESSLDEVLQIDRIFTSVSRGEFASAIDVRHVIGDDDISTKDAIKYILDHGELQVAAGERAFTQEETMRDICTIVAQKLVHPTTKRPYTAVFIEDAAKSLGLAARSDQPAKRQATWFIKELLARQLFPVMRAQMRLRLKADHLKFIDDMPYSEVSRSDDGDVTIDIDPELFRAINETCSNSHAPVTIIDYAVSDTTIGDASVFDATTTANAQHLAMASGSEHSGAPAVSATQAKKAKRDARKQARAAALGGESDSD
jgi:ribosome maturation protein SDO1